MLCYGPYPELSVVVDLETDKITTRDDIVETCGLVDDGVIDGFPFFLQIGCDKVVVV